MTFVDIKTIESNPNAIISVINQVPKDLTIINYEIDDCKTTDELKNKLKYLTTLQNIHNETVNQYN